MRFFCCCYQENTDNSSDDDNSTQVAMPSDDADEMPTSHFLRIIQENGSMEWLLKKPQYFLLAYLVSLSVRLLDCSLRKNTHPTCMKDNFLSIPGTLVGPFVLICFTALQALWQYKSQRSSDISVKKHLLFLAAAIVQTAICCIVALESTLHANNHHLDSSSPRLK